MTCVAGIEIHGEGVVMGCDSVLTNTEGEMHREMASKVQKKNGWLIGFSGDWSLYQAIQDAEIEKVRVGRRAAQNVAKSIGDAAGKASGQLMIAGAGKIWVCYNDWQIMRSKGKAIFAAIGTGTDVALGFLEASKNWKDPEKRIRGALKAAAKFRNDVASPFRVYRQTL